MNITITLKDNIIQHVDLPDGITVIVKDYDIDGDPLSEDDTKYFNIKHDALGVYEETVYQRNNSKFSFVGPDDSPFYIGNE